MTSSLRSTTAPAKSLHPSAPVASTISPDSPVTSVLHPDTPKQTRLNTLVPYTSKTTTKSYIEYEASFPQHGKIEPGLHYRVEKTEVLVQPGNRDNDSVLIICAFNDAQSWGVNRSIKNFFEVVGSFDYLKAKISITLLTSSMTEFTNAKQLFGFYIELYPRLSAGRRRMLARYRNYALLSTMELWHQHVVWVDADITAIPSGLLRKMVSSGRDILEPMCVRNIRGKWLNYDKNARVDHRKVRSPNAINFVPGPLNARSFHNLPDRSKPFVPLDSVGGTMLYVRADIHRQGVMFPVHYVIGSEWGREGYDGIETEGLCYTAHFLGYKCWGMPPDIIRHVT
ncbi:hypothetical protein PInf_010103 [Phytophthora infestans]|nr:hypothetical protein PInf_010103 [Phytophthora infestans]